MKKYIIIGGVLALLVGTVWLNTRLNKNDPSVAAEPVSQSTPQIDAAAAEASPQDYFAAFREERDETRALEIEYLDEVIATSAQDAETLAEAQQQKLTLVDSMEREFVTEQALLALGFTDAAVTVSGGTVNVVVPGGAISDTDAAKILDAVLRETEVSASNVRIIPAG